MRHVKILALALLSNVNGAVVDYTTNGDNWGVKYPTCKTGTQSPIDLKSSAITLDGKGDFFKFYSNIYKRRVTWNADKSTNYATVNADAGTLTPD